MNVHSAKFYTENCGPLLAIAFKKFGIVFKEGASAEEMVEIETKIHEFKLEYDACGPYAMAMMLDAVQEKSGEALALEWMEFFNKSFFVAY